MLQGVKKLNLIIRPKNVSQNTRPNLSLLNITLIRISIDRQGFSE
jgi:hypothetical protein